MLGRTMLCSQFRKAFTLSLALTTLSALARAQSAPVGSHPRIWLDSATLAGLKSQAGVANGAVERAKGRCDAARTDPSKYTTGGWQGFEFVTTLSSCLVAYEASGSPDDLTTAIEYWNVLLDDYQNVGDGAGGDDVVTHDTGYAMRTFAPYSAIAYDWLHDAPGVTESLRSHARERFAAWTDFYSTNGYLRHMPGSNYEAGYAFAATLIAIAEGGEAGPAGDALWTNVRDTIWGADLTSGLRAGGVLAGGDWPEGWQYGPLSVLEHALGARAMGENGAPIAGIGAWADSLVLRFANGLTPSTQKAFAGGDNESTTPNLEPSNGPLVAAIAGPASEQARGWARALNSGLGLRNDNPLFDALAAARQGNAAPIPETSATSYLATGVGNWYVRGAWSKDTVWSVFQCSRRVVDDHQHNDAGNWVFTRGADDVVVDPSPYGSLSTLTGNAPAVDSAVLPDGYSPSQGNWGQTTRLVWAKQSESGIGVARCDYADQFRKGDTASDVAHAVRDFVFVPSGDRGTVVLFDRVVTNDAARALHLRVRSPSTLSLAGDVASTTVGASALEVRKLWSTSGAPAVRSMPTTPECDSSNRGTCDTSRLPSGDELRMDVAGPNAGSIFVVDARAAGAPPAASSLLSGNGYRGVLLGAPSTPVAVVMNDGFDAAAAGSLAYHVPRGTGATHVVVDAPVDASGRSDVKGSIDGNDCAITVAPHAGATPSFDGRALVVHVSSSCDATEDAVVPQTIPSGTAGTSGSGSAGSTGTTSSGGAASIGGASGAGGASTGVAGSGDFGGRSTSGTGSSGGTTSNGPNGASGASGGSSGVASVTDSGDTEAGSGSCSVAQSRVGVSYSSSMAAAIAALLFARRRKGGRLGQRDGRHRRADGSG